jgi:formate dehydrogenase major subunit
MYMMGENPFLSDPNTNKVRKALSQLEFLVVQDIFLTETAEFADVIFPATSYMEKEGTYTNTDRRVQIGRKVLDAPGEARLDWQIIQDMSNRIGLEMNYESPREIFEELVSVMPNYAGLSYDNLGETGKLYPNSDPFNSDGTVVLFEERFGTDDGQGAPGAGGVAARPGSCPTRSTPFILNTGPAARALAHRHDDAALVRARRDPARGARVPQPGRRGRDGGRRRRLRARHVAPRDDRAARHGCRTATRPGRASSRSTSARRRPTC